MKEPPIFLLLNFIFPSLALLSKSQILPTYWYWYLFFNDIFAEALTYKWICSTQLSFDLLHFFRTFSSNYIINFFWKQILNLTFSNFVFSPLNRNLSGASNAFSIQQNIWNYNILKSSSDIHLWALIKMFLPQEPISFAVISQD